MVLASDHVERFVQDGFVKVEGAFPRDVADEARALLWKATGYDSDNPSTWTEPVVRLPGFDQEPFRVAANTPQLHAAFDQLVGAGRWVPRNSLGTFPIRFPNLPEPGDTGWHIEASYVGPDGHSPRSNLWSRGRALLMLFLFSDIGEDDAPTRVRVGSHLDIPPLLEAAGEAGADVFEIAAAVEEASAHRPETVAAGAAGDVYLCHPFLVHAAQAHRGRRPRFMAQPPLCPAGDLELDRADGDYSPVERAVRQGLGL